MNIVNLSSLKVLTDLLLERPRRIAGIATLLLIALLALAWCCLSPFRDNDKLLIVSYDAASKYFSSINREWAEQNELPLDSLRISHAGSVHQAQALTEGLDADIVCLASASDMNYVARRNLQMDNGWRDSFPNGASPFYSTLALFVRNDKRELVHSWKDLHEHKLHVMLPNPRISGAGQYAYLSLLADSSMRHGDDEQAIRDEIYSFFLKADLINLGSNQTYQLFRNTRDVDVLILWENQALLEQANLRAYTMVTPSMGLIAEPRIARLTPRDIPTHKLNQILDYIHFLYSPKGQAIASQSGLRPRDISPSAARFRTFTPTKLYSVEELFGPWDQVWEQHFSTEGSFEKIMVIRNARSGGSE